MSSKISTLVLGASENAERYSYLAIVALRKKEHPVWAVGKKAGQVLDVPIHTTLSTTLTIDTITLYLNPAHQEAYYESIVALRPRRIIFNPGTENPVLATLANQLGIITQEACTLVLLQTGQYHLH